MKYCLGPKAHMIRSYSERKQMMIKIGLQLLKAVHRHASRDASSTVVGVAAGRVMLLTYILHIIFAVYK